MIFVKEDKDLTKSTLPIKFLTNTVDKPNTGFVKQPHGQRYQQKGEHIGRRRYHSSCHQYQHNSMFAVTTHKSGRKQAQFGKKPGENRDLKNQPHDQTHDQQGNTYESSVMRLTTSSLT